MRYYIESKSEIPLTERMAVLRQASDAANKAKEERKAAQAARKAAKEAAKAAAGGDTPATEAAA
jgi:hypothetical protein